MVGIPGKYKGCETCRRRRVKCSNERPFCQNCIGSGRACEGYEREMVFITGTPETKGRVASHPKKSAPSKKPKPPASNKAGGAEKLQVFPRPSLVSAWDDYITLSNQGVEFPALVTTMQTNIQSVTRRYANQDGLFNIQLPPYSAADLQPMVNAGDALGLNAQCLVRQKAAGSEQASTESYCAFLFQLDPSAATWRLTAEQMNGLGPRHFASFPNHHFFVRVYRHVAMNLALLSRRDTFLSNPEWTTVPWEQHPKSLLDQLFDLMLRLPFVFTQTDRITPSQATLSRRTQAQELLHHCLILEAQFRLWLLKACKGTEEHPYPFWAKKLRRLGGAVPFTTAYAFKDGAAGIMFLYYWMAQIPFHQCIETLHIAIFQPVVDAYPKLFPELPPNLQIDPTQYQDGRELAANICRGLDSALDATAQPDMLLAPMTAALNLYRDINATSQDGLLEILWLDNFKKKLSAKGQAVADALQSHQWVEVARF